MSIADGGIVFGPGKAGTVQEIFQDTTLNFYRKKPVPRPSLMVLLGVDFWNPSPGNVDADPAHIPDPDRNPVYPLLSTLATQARQKFSDALLLTDDAKEIIDFLHTFIRRSALQMRLRNRVLRGSKVELWRRFKPPRLRPNVRLSWKGAEEHSDSPIAVPP